VLDSRQTRKRGGAKLEYKVHCANMSLAESSWKLTANLQNVHEAVQTFHEQYLQKLGGLGNPDEQSEGARQIQNRNSTGKGEGTIYSIYKNKHNNTSKEKTKKGKPKQPPTELGGAAVSPGPQKEVPQEGNGPCLVLDFTLEEADALLSPLKPNNKRVATPQRPSMHQGGGSSTQSTNPPNLPRPT
jgi:hypothetical protein